jgi:hypothetical protein
MKIIITESQSKILFESDDYQSRWDRFERKMKRKYNLIDNAVGIRLIEENPKDWGDMYDYAGYITREVSGEIMYGENGIYSEGDDEFELEAWVDNYIKDNFSLRIFEYYLSNK